MQWADVLIAVPGISPCPAVGPGTEARDQPFGEEPTYAQGPGVPTQASLHQLMVGSVLTRVSLAHRRGLDKGKFAQAEE